MSQPARMPTSKSDGKVSIRKVEKSFGRNAVLKGVDLEIADREFVILLGPSGCGKTTLLRILAGLEWADVGEVWMGDRRVDALEPKERNVAMVFQSYALYPHMTAFDNQAFSMKLRGKPKEEIRERVTHAARTLGLEALLDRFPRQLSGGQRQRVSMGRAIVRSRPGLSIRRTTFEPRRAASGAYAWRDQGFASQARNDLNLRHTRSG